MTEEDPSLDAVRTLTGTDMGYLSLPAEVQDIVVLDMGIHEKLDEILRRLQRLDPLVEYAETLLDQKARLAKWLPGKRT